MSVCNLCYDSGNLIDYCAEVIVIPGLPPTEEYNAFIQHHGTGLIQVFEVVVNPAGEIEIQTGEGGLLLDPLQVYSFWITDKNSNSPKELITINEVEYTCISFQTSKSTTGATNVCLHSC
jgi:hypothetical protein